ncbi:MAG: hypothetical protein PVG03_06645 [Desulfarculaceae bacterium]|jgi:hypothetical protein
MNSIRIRENILFGVEAVEGSSIPGAYRDSFVVEAELKQTWR